MIPVILAVSVVLGLSGTVVADMYDGNSGSIISPTYSVCGDNGCPDFVDPTAGNEGNGGEADGFGTSDAID